jgi:hypothetical protein
MQLAKSNLTLPHVYYSPAGIEIHLAGLNKPFYSDITFPNLDKIPLW